MSSMCMVDVGALPPPRMCFSISHWIEQADILPDGVSQKAFIGYYCRLELIYPAGSNKPDLSHIILRRWSHFVWFEREWGRIYPLLVAQPENRLPVETTFTSVFQKTKLADARKSVLTAYIQRLLSISCLQDFVAQFLELDFALFKSKPAPLAPSSTLLSSSGRRASLPDATAAAIAAATAAISPVRIFDNTVVVADANEEKKGNTDEASRKARRDKEKFATANRALLEAILKAKASGEVASVRLNLPFVSSQQDPTAWEEGFGSDLSREGSRSNSPVLRPASPPLLARAASPVALRSTSPIQIGAAAPPLPAGRRAASPATPSTRPVAVGSARAASPPPLPPGRSLSPAPSPSMQAASPPSMSRVPPAGALPAAASGQVVPAMPSRPTGLALHRHSASVNASGATSLSLLQSAPRAAPSPPAQPPPTPPLSAITEKEPRKIASLQSRFGTMPAAQLALAAASAAPAAAASAAPLAIVTTPTARAAATTASSPASAPARPPKLPPRAGSLIVTSVAASASVFPSFSAPPPISPRPGAIATALSQMQQQRAVSPPPPPVMAFPSAFCACAARADASAFCAHCGKPVKRAVNSKP